MAISLDDLLQGSLGASAIEGGKLSGIVDRNAVQGLTVVNTTLIHQHGSTADDAATMASLRTAIHVPNKDA